MTKEEFIKLTIPQRMELLWSEGEFLSEKVYYDDIISLFSVQNLLVEVFFNRVYEEITSVAIQENNEILYQHVKDLELGELFNEKN